MSRNDDNDSDEYGFFDVDSDSGSNDDGDKVGGNDSDGSAGSDTSKKKRGKGRDWTHVRTFGDDSIEAEKEAKKPLYSTYRTIAGRFEYKCKSDGCKCLVRFVKKFMRSSTFWSVSMHGHHEHQSDNINEPWISESENYTIDVAGDPDSRGLSHVEIEFLEGIITELGNTRTTALKEVEGLWLQKYQNYRNNGGDVVPPFPSEKKVKYRLSNRSRSFTKDDTVEALEAYVMSCIENNMATSRNRPYEKPRASVLAHPDTSKSQLVRYYRHPDKDDDNRAVWILCYTTGMLVSSFEDCVRVVASDGAYGYVLINVLILCHQCSITMSSMFKYYVISVLILCHQCSIIMSSMIKYYVISVLILCHQCSNIMSSMFKYYVINDQILCHQCSNIMSSMIYYYVINFQILCHQCSNTILSIFLIESAQTSSIWLLLLLLINVRLGTF